MILINSSPKDTLKIFQPFLPVCVPIGIGYLLAVAEREGIHARFIDEQVEEHVFDRVAQYTQEMERPYFFGFSVLTAAFKQALQVSKRVKELYPDSVICFGGPHPTALPEEVLAHDHIDIVVRGEGEEILPQIYRCVKEKRDFSRLNGISYRRNNQIIHNGGALIVHNLDSLPLFPYHLFTSPQYDLGFVVSSRGCPHNCIFCSNRVTTGKKYRFRAADAIIEELEILYHHYGKRFILFVDDNLLVNRKRISLLLERIKQKGFDQQITFSFQARGDNVDHALLKDLYQTGFKHAFFGLETASERIMELLKKGETVAQCVQAVRLAKQIGFQVSATFIYALPGETHEDRMDCIRLSKELQLDLVRYNNATPYPGTALYDMATRENRLHIQGIYENFNSVSTFIENPFRKIPFSYVPEGNSEGEIRNDILFSYLAFYCNMTRVKNILFSRDKSVGWFITGRNFVEQIKKIPALCLLGWMLCVKFGELFLNIVFKKESALSFEDCVKLLNGKWEKRGEITVWREEQYDKADEGSVRHDFNS